MKKKSKIGASAEWNQQLPQSGFNAEILRMLRTANEMTQGDLAEQIGVVQPTISKWEDGFSEPALSDLERLSHVLRCPIQIFFEQEKAIAIGPCYHFRKRSSLGVKKIESIESRANLLRISTNRLLQRIGEFPIRFEEMDLETHGTPEAVATSLRSLWEVPVGPISNMVALIESAGGIVIECNFETDKIDALSQWRGGYPPVFFVNRNSPPDRARFTLAHELGHVAMHRIHTLENEEQADRFASEFLMPSRQIRHDLTQLNLEKALQLKMKWKVSIAAIIRKARDLEAITQNQYQSLYVQLSKYGYRKNEPGKLPKESPKTVKRIVTAMIESANYTLDQIAQLALCKDGEQFATRFLDQVQLDPSTQVINQCDSRKNALVSPQLKLHIED